ncbi:MAG: hypothetical protein ACLSVD_14390 [Eggerthellaceae bacterium]
MFTRDQIMEHVWARRTPPTRTA